VKDTTVAMGSYQELRLWLLVAAVGERHNWVPMVRPRRAATVGMVFPVLFLVLALREQAVVAARLHIVAFQVVAPRKAWEAPVVVETQFHLPLPLHTTPLPNPVMQIRVQVVVGCRQLTQQWDRPATLAQAAPA